MAIILVGGIKGGSGKSTVATNLCVMRALEKRDTLFVDADDQETATDFTLKRNEHLHGQAGYTGIKLTGSAVRTEVLRLRSKYQDIIIDTGGRDTNSQRAGLTVADVYLVPFVPRSFDVWTLDKVGRIVNEMRAANPELRAYAFINRADPQGQDNGEAAELLRESETFEFIDAPLGTRKAFGNAGGQGMSVCELSPDDPKATHEMKRLYQRVFNVELILKAGSTTQLEGGAHGYQ
jgi:chromosome partitioning protein